MPTSSAFGRHDGLFALGWLNDRGDLAQRPWRSPGSMTLAIRPPGGSITQASDNRWRPGQLCVHDSHDFSFYCPAGSESIFVVEPLPSEFRLAVHEYSRSEEGNGVPRFGDDHH